MARINAELIDRLRDRIEVGRSQVYYLIDATVRETGLPRHLAAILLAMRRGVTNITRYATESELAQVRAAVTPPAQLPSVVLPSNSEWNANSRRRKSRPTRKSNVGKALSRRGTSVFVVHGRNESLRRALFSFLRAIGLEPLEWNQVLSRTRKAAPYVGEILDAAFREAVAVVVLLTPDDLAQLKKEFLRAPDPGFERRLTGQARPNVLFEAGMAFGRNPDSTVLVQVGDMRPFSDVAGRHVVRLTNSTKSRQDLIDRLANAGCNVNISGKTDWQSEGDFKI